MTRRRSGTSGTGCIPTALSCILLELGSTGLGELQPRAQQRRDRPALCSPAACTGEARTGVGAPSQPCVAARPFATGEEGGCGQIEPGMCPAPLQAPALPKLQCLPSPCQGLGEPSHSQGRNAPALLPRNCTGLPTANLSTSTQPRRLLAAGTGGARWDAGSRMGHSMEGGTWEPGGTWGAGQGLSGVAPPSWDDLQGARVLGEHSLVVLLSNAALLPSLPPLGLCAGKGWCPRAVPPRQGSGASGMSPVPGPGVPALCRAPALCWAHDVRSGTPSARPPASSPGVKVTSSGSGYFPWSSGRKLSSRCRPS
ncbi:uncharacterized protein LOC122155418 [Centrocercus urophasianus]|uniref:uncharacterized protein LOC122155418 n=1 Tax=Centrocercus urophasianus TaxID=9002 RepID=UPI001C64CEF2|nr:uncharacterized protein LOC122155418 [Centrocercus urophasianus]